jgi:hypothetical protein
MTILKVPHFRQLIGPYLHKSLDCFLQWLKGSVHKIKDQFNYEGSHLQNMFVLQCVYVEVGMMK